MENQKSKTPMNVKEQSKLELKKLEVSLSKNLTSVQKESALYGLSKFPAMISQPNAVSRSMVIFTQNQSNSTTNSPKAQHPAPTKGNIVISPQPPSYIDRYTTYKTRVYNAYQNRKIFTIHGYYPAVKSALLRRGWIEKIHHASNKLKELQQQSLMTLLQNAKNGNDSEVVLLSKLLGNFPSYFIWQPKSFFDYYKFAAPYRNRVRLRHEFDYTTKDGLLACVRKAIGKRTVGAQHIIHPRTFRLENQQELEDFEHYYKLTCCFNLLLFVSENSVDSICSSTGDLDTSFLANAIKFVQSEMSALKQKQANSSNFSDWSTFYTNSCKIINGDATFRCSESREKDIFRKVKYVLADAKKFYRSLEMDGCLNVWILKPSNYCRGCGIALMKSFNQIVEHAQKHPKYRYIVQKYIERPLLIYKTKFDIRQYVLVTVGSDTLHIYLYKDMYLKFSSQEFDLSRLHESVHITNFAVQKKYRNGQRSEKLPLHNMWSLKEFKNHLTSIGKVGIWEDFIFPRMKDTIVSTMMASLEQANLAKNSFELYGVDLMITESFHPVLIEINATPDMTASTCVTAHLCPLVLNDVVKVVVDLPQNPYGDIGNFLSVYKHAYKNVVNITVPKPVIVTSAKPFPQAPISSPKNSVKSGTNTVTKNASPPVKTQKAYNVSVKNGNVNISNQSPKQLKVPNNSPKTRNLVKTLKGKTTTPQTEDRKVNVRPLNKIAKKPVKTESNSAIVKQILNVVETIYGTRKIDQIFKNDGQIKKLVKTVNPRK